MKLHPEIKAEWLARLRSGEYQQTTQKLRRDGSYCCLGVLCDIAVKRGIAEWEGVGYAMFEKVRTPGDFQNDPEYNTASLPQAVLAWARPPSTDFDSTSQLWVEYDELLSLMEEIGTEAQKTWMQTRDPDYSITLDALNDSGFFTFEDIANVIERLL